MKTKEVKLSELTPDNLNANKGTQRGAGMLEKSLRDFGAGRSVLVDKAGRIIAGNKTIEAASAIGLEDAVMVETDGSQVVIVKRTDLDIDSPEGRGLAIADNRVAEVGLDWDIEALEKIGEELDLGEFWFADELPDLDLGSIDGDDEPTGDADAVPEVEDVPTSKRGDLWILGDHRVLCGDSTSADDVARLMNGERADMVFTDPPYNVSFNGRSGKFDVIKNDDLEEGDFEDFIDATVKTIKSLDPKIYYIWCNWKFYSTIQTKLEFKACIVWAKNVFGLGVGYRHQHEFCLFNGRIDESIKNESDLWEIKKDSNYLHPTQKPTDLSRRALGNHSSAAVIVDLFGGSGSTTIGCEAEGRRCFSIEIDPQYVDVIVKRWQDYTGNEAKHEDGRTFAEVAEERLENE